MLLRVKDSRIEEIEDRDMDDDRCMINLKSGFARDAGYGLHHCFSAGSIQEAREKLGEVFACSCKNCVKAVRS